MLDLTAKWIKATEAQLRGEQLRDTNEEAIVEMFEICSNNPDFAVKVIADIIDQKPSEKVVNCLGAGPVEELLIKHPYCFSKLISQTPDVSLLRKCFKHVNLDSNDGPIARQLRDYLRNSK